MKTLDDDKNNRINYYKSLDEVINTLLKDRAVTYYGNVIVPLQDLADALHYLEIFRDTINALNVERENCIEAACKYIEAEKELESQKVQMMWVDKHFEFEITDNQPLTWDELKQMEGKPVWLEVKYHNPEATYKYWTIVKYFDSNEGGDMVFTGTGFYYKDLLEVDWQVYRKERND